MNTFLIKRQKELERVDEYIRVKDDRRKKMTSSKHYDVIILGAGMAGISAAHYLASKSSGGAQIRIGLIEAQDRY